MSKVNDFFKSPHIQIALATGFSIIIMAYFSKRVLPKSIGYLPSAIPPFFMAIYEAVYTKYKNKKISTSWYWVVAILLTTAIIIGLYAI